VYQRKVLAWIPACGAARCSTAGEVQVRELFRLVNSGRKRVSLTSAAILQKLLDPPVSVTDTFSGSYINRLIYRDISSGTQLDTGEPQGTAHLPWYYRQRIRRLIMTYDEMNELLKNELSAIETYRQALEKKDTDPEHVTAINELSAILDDHQRAASRIEAAIRQKGGEPAHGSGAWGAWSKVVMGTAQLFGDKAALKALKEGEESGLKEYEDALGDTGIPQDQKSLISDLLATQRMHVQTLDALMSRV
jgi:hypothetical protein